MTRSSYVLQTLSSISSCFLDALIVVIVVNDIVISSVVVFVVPLFGFVVFYWVLFHLPWICPTGSIL